MRHTISTSLLVFVAVTIMLQARAESTRWWWAAVPVRELGLSPAQSRELDRIYDSTLPARRRLAEQMTALADRVQQLNQADASDEEVMPATERLTRAQADRCELEQALVRRVERALAPEQRPLFRALLRRKIIGFD